MLQNCDATDKRSHCPDPAKPSGREALRVHPDDSEAAYRLGCLYQKRHRGQEALEAFQSALRIDPGHARALCGIGEVWRSQGRLQQALICFEQAEQIEPGCSQALFNLALIHRKLGQIDRAEAVYRRIIAHYPGLKAPHWDLGAMYIQQKRYPEAIHHLRQAAAIDPASDQCQFLLGTAYRLTGAFANSLHHLGQCLKIRPDRAGAWNELALTLKNTGDLDRALICLDRAIELKPDLAEAYWNRSFLHLLKENYNQGWKDFEWRFKIAQWKHIYPHRLLVPRWSGLPLPGKVILVHDEQGLGDTIQFVRFLPSLKKLCARVVLETRSELLSVLSSAKGIDRFIVRSSNGRPAAEFDAYIPLMSLAGIFNTNAGSLPGTIPYLFAAPEKVARWRSVLTGDKPNIGLIWAGRPQHVNDHNRSCHLSELTPLLNIEGLQFVSLQNGPAADQAAGLTPGIRMVRLGERLHDFSDTAALLANLDLLITVDTAAAHLAGALGRPVWTMIPFVPDWRWGLEQAVTPWYPSMRLFRQPRIKDWASVVQEMKKLLMRPPCLRR